MNPSSACILGRATPLSLRHWCLITSFALLGSSACSGSDGSSASSDSGGSAAGTMSASSSAAQTSNSGTLTSATTGAATTTGTTGSSATTATVTVTASAASTTTTTSGTSSSSATSATTSTAGTTGGTTGGAGGAGASTTESTATTGGGGEQCPADATFCSSFAEDALPEGAVYKLNGDPATPWTSDFEVDTTVFNTAPSALRVRPNTEGSGAYKMLAVPTPGAAFWVRFYIRSDVDLGHNDHNVFAAAAGSDNPNDSTYIEFAEDVGIAFNSHDVVRWPEGFGRLQDGGTNPFTLAKDEWHCIEISYDGQARVQQLYVGDTLQIDAQSYPDGANAFTTFKFGYNSLHGTTRNTWYDDVAVAAARIGCF